MSESRRSLVMASAALVAVLAQLVGFWRYLERFPDDRVGLTRVGAHPGRLEPVDLLWIRCGPDPNLLWKTCVRLWKLGPGRGGPSRLRVE